MDQFIGKKLDGRYQIESLIGVGGMANVYRAEDLRTQRTVAVKILREEFLQNAELVRRFKNESKAISILNHPNIVKVYDVSVTDRLNYIVMEYIDGITLKEYMKQRGGPLTWKEVVHFTQQILSALEHAHSQGVVHRDVKPQNIMLLANGSLKMMDFGIARFSREQSVTESDKAIGSVHYISPEQALGGAVDQRTDIYSVGVILFEMLCGRLPFDGESPVSVALQQVEQNPKALRSLNPNVPVGLEQITLHAMAKNPDDRYADCGEMIADLRRWLADPKTTFPAYAATPVKKAAEFVRNKVPKKTGADTPKPAGRRKKLKDRLTTPLSRLFAVTCGVVVASVLFVFVMFQIYQPFQKVEDITLPNLVGVDYSAATAGNAYPDIRIKLESEDFNTEYEAGQIYRQSPSAGKSVKKGSTVQVWVSAGGQMIPIPTFTNQEATAVYAKLVSLGLKYSTTEIASDTIAEGSVVRTSPEAGQSAPAGSTVVVYVSTGSNKERVQVPEVLGYPEEVAVQTLKDAQFEVAVTYQVSDYQYDGLVMSQSPASPSMVPIGSKVTIVVGTVDESAAVGEATVTLQTIPPDLPGTVTVTAVLNGATVYSDTIEPQNTRLISIPLQGTGTCMVDVLIDGMVYKSASVDFDAGQYYWTADYSGSFGE